MVTIRHINTLVRLANISTLELPERQLYAKLAVKELCYLLNVSTPAMEQAASPVNELTYDEKINMSAGLKIAAIKSYRSRTGSSLLEAKNACEVWHHNNPTW